MWRLSAEPLFDAATGAPALPSARAVAWLSAGMRLAVTAESPGAVRAAVLAAARLGALAGSGDPAAATERAVVGLLAAGGGGGRGAAELLAFVLNTPRRADACVRCVRGRHARPRVAPPSAHMHSPMRRLSICVRPCADCPYAFAHALRRYVYCLREDEAVPTRLGLDLDVMKLSRALRAAGSGGGARRSCVWCGASAFGRGACVEPCVQCHGLAAYCGDACRMGDLFAGHAAECHGGAGSPAIVRGEGYMGKASPARVRVPCAALQIAVVVCAAPGGAKVPVPLSWTVARVASA